MCKRLLAENRKEKNVCELRSGKKINLPPETQETIHQSQDDCVSITSSLGELPGVVYEVKIYKIAQRELLAIFYRTFW